MGFLLLVFVLPLLWFFGQLFAAEEGAAEVLRRFLASSAYRQILFNTFIVAINVTVACAVIAYPLAALLARVRGTAFLLLLYCVLFPLWISVLVRTFSWMMLLERNGPVNRFLLDLRLIESPVQLLFSNLGVHIGMIHVLIPYAVLPIFAALRQIDPKLLQASDGLGASPLQTFRRIYLPLSMPGVFGGAALVFLLALGFYITPALLGGVRAVTISMLIASLVSERLDWPTAAAASLVLATAVAVFLAAASRFLSFGQEVAAK
jgi:putative spermidine/putrescine transport system permease protein